MLNHPPIDPHNPLVNKKPFGLTFIQHHETKDQVLIRALKVDKHFLKAPRANIKTEGAKYLDKEDTDDSSVETKFYFASKKY